MADPLSIAASIAALLDLAGKVMGYINDTKDASEDQRRLREELVSTTGVLFFLKYKAEKPSDDGISARTFESLDGPNGPLEQFKSALERLAAKLNPAQGSTQKVKNRLMWPFQKAEVQEILNLMERQKSSFNLAITSGHMYVINPPSFQILTHV
jgi:hypothetical protein